MLVELWHRGSVSPPLLATSPLGTGRGLRPLRRPTGIELLGHRRSTPTSRRWLGWVRPSRHLRLSGSLGPGDGSLGPCSSWPHPPARRGPAPRSRLPPPRRHPARSTLAALRRLPRRPRVPSWTGRPPSDGDLIFGQGMAGRLDRVAVIAGLGYRNGQN